MRRTLSHRQKTSEPNTNEHLVHHNYYKSNADIEGINCYKGKES